MSISVSIAVRPSVAVPQPTGLWQIVGDELLQDWGFKSRTLTITKPDGTLFSQLPSVMRYAPKPEYAPGDYRVDETWLRDEYIRINNYDGDGLRRCENYLWKADTALYNNQGFPKRQYLTMSRNVVQEIEWAGQYLKFKTLRPGNSTAGMTNATHPQYVHRFDLVGHNAAKETYHTWNTPRGNVYYFLTSVEGFAFIHERFVRKVV